MRVLGGLMALGYEIGSIMRRTSEVYSDDRQVPGQGVWWLAVVAALLLLHNRC